MASRLRGKFFMVREMMMHSDIIRVFAAAQAAAPSVVFIDDADIVIGGWRPIDGHRGNIACVHGAFWRMLDNTMQVRTSSDSFLAGWMDLLAVVKGRMAMSWW
jgi:hypothetical protein